MLDPDLDVSNLRLSEINELDHYPEVPGKSHHWTVSSLVIPRMIRTLPTTVTSVIPKKLTTK